MQKYKKGVSIVMPCLNEEKTVGACIQKAKSFLEKYGMVGEIIIADNGSTDDSTRIAQESGARVVNISCKGYGAALRGGIQAAEYEYVVMGDADDSYDFTALSGFIEMLDQGYELVMGNRFRGGYCTKSHAFFTSIYRESGIVGNRKTVLQKRYRGLPLWVARI